MHKDISLFEAFLQLKNTEELERFFKDLCTPQEIASFKERWRVCQSLDTGQYSYREIREQTGASLTTIGRVARFLKEEHNNGYKLVLERLKSK